MNGHYTLELPLAEIEPGYCEWTPSEIAYAINLASEEPSNVWHGLINIGISGLTPVSSMRLSCKTETLEYQPPKPYVSCMVDWLTPLLGLRTVMENQESLEVNFVAAPNIPRDVAPYARFG